MQLETTACGATLATLPLGFEEGEKGRVMGRTNSSLSGRHRFASKVLFLSTVFPNFNRSIPLHGRRLRPREASLSVREKREREKEGTKKTPFAS